MNKLWIVLPLLFGCAAQSLQPADISPASVSNALPFGVALLPVVLDSLSDPLLEDQVSSALVTAFQNDVFVSFERATHHGDAVRSGANYVMTCAYVAADEARPATLKASFHAFDSNAELSGKSAGLALAVDTPVIAGDWHAAGLELVRLVRANADQLRSPGLAPFGLDTANLKFTKRGARSVLQGAVAFTPGSRSTHLRSVVITMPTGESFETGDFAGSAKGRQVDFESELPELQSGEVLTIEIVAGSRVKYSRRYSVRVP
ncbi:MAG: hypothetical protein ACI8TQ_001133 [Planctomycetota bacterium]|jgi:hypothetical protein